MNSSVHAPSLTLVLVILVGRQRGAAVLKHLDAFATNALALRQQLGIDARLVEVPSIDYVPHEVRAWQPEVVIFVPSYTDPIESVIAMCNRVRSQPRSPKLVYFDTYDQTSSPHFGVLPVVDRYLKSKKLRNLDSYAGLYDGGNPLSHFAKQHYHCDLSGWNFGSPIPAQEADKLRPSWSFGVSRDFARLQRAADRFSPKWASRPYEVNCRIGLNPSDEIATHWYAVLRREAAKALDALGSQHRCTGSVRVSRRRYLMELLASKVVFSPFGWGEVCFRDYEAVAAGCLLIKPEMKHLRTSPDIFRDGETYVSVRWDLADLSEKIAHFLRHPEESSQIASQGAMALRDYSLRNGFVRDVQHSLDGLIGAGGALVATEERIP
mgnify:CR=1 FL=1